VSAYIIYQYNIIDCDRVNELGPRVEPIMRKHNGEIAIGDYIISLEGSPYSHLVMYKFESQKVALDFYQEEQKINSEARNQIIKGTVTMVPGNGNRHELGDS